MSFLHVDIAELKAHVANLFERFPEIAEDDDLRVGMLEGETNISVLVSRLVRKRNEAMSLANAGKEIRSDQSERISRFERQQKGYEALIKSVMLAADLPKIVLPEATVSITKPRTKVEILEVTDLPQGYFETERKPKTADIKAALERGEEIPGARLALGDDGLMVRTK